MDSTENSVSEPKAPTGPRTKFPKAGNPNWVEGHKPVRAPRGLAKFSAWKMAQLLDLWGPDVPKFAKMMMKNALDPNNKDQLGWAKEVACRIFPASKAIEVTGLGGRAIEMQVLVNGIKEFDKTTLIEGSSEELPNE